MSSVYSCTRAKYIVSDEAVGEDAIFKVHVRDKHVMGRDFVDNKIAWVATIRKTYYRMSGCDIAYHNLAWMTIDGR